MNRQTAKGDRWIPQRGATLPFKNPTDEYSTLLAREIFGTSKPKSVLSFSSKQRESDSNPTRHGETRLEWGEKASAKRSEEKRVLDLKSLRIYDVGELPRAGAGKKFFDVSEKGDLAIYSNSELWLAFGTDIISVPLEEENVSRIEFISLTPSPLPAVRSLASIIVLGDQGLWSIGIAYRAEQDVIFPEARFATWSQGRIFVWDGKRIFYRLSEVVWIPLIEYTSTIYSMKSSDRMLAVGTEGRVDIIGYLPTRNNGRIKSFGLSGSFSHPGKVSALAFSPGGDRLAVGGLSSNLLRIWNPGLQELKFSVESPGDITDIIWHGDNIFCSHYGGLGLTIWNRSLNMLPEKFQGDVFELSISSHPPKLFLLGEEIISSFKINE